MYRRCRILCRTYDINLTFPVLEEVMKLAVIHKRDIPSYPEAALKLICTVCEDIASPMRQAPSIYDTVLCLTDHPKSRALDR
ncbi:hypothetical protein EV182_002287, partial [Spiromyces aspiralis]